MKKVFSSALVLAASLGIFLMSPEYNPTSTVVHATSDASNANDSTSNSADASSAADTGDTADQIVVEKARITKLQNSYKGVVVNFAVAQNATGYNIYRRRKKSEPWIFLAGVSPKSKFKYIDTDAMKEGGIYTYMVQAYNGEVLGPESDTATIARVNITRAKVNIRYKQKSARNMQKLINDFRQGSEAWSWNITNTQKVYVTGLPKLAYDYSLEKIAMLRAAEVAIKFSHERPNGNPCFSALEEAGYEFKYAGENIAYGYKNETDAFKAFQEINNKYEGQGHRRNMLSSDYNVCAIGHVKVNGMDYWVQMFAFTENDSDYTRTIESKTNVTLEIASDDISTYKSKLKKADVVYKDYAPSKVNILSKKVSKKRITVNFSMSKGAYGYEIYRSEKKKTDYKKIKTINNQSRLMFIDKNVEKKKTYYYYIVPFRVSHDTYIYGKKSDIIKVKAK